MCRLLLQYLIPRLACAIAAIQFPFGIAVGADQPLRIEERKMLRQERTIPALVQRARVARVEQGRRSARARRVLAVDVLEARILLSADDTLDTLAGQAYYEAGPPSLGAGQPDAA